jgi:hypothetical protein
MNLDFLKKIRRNHALEHATIAIALSKSDKHGVVAGNSTQGGFFVYGDIPDDVLSESASEALERLKAGEKDLAISPYCGTNIVVAAGLAGLACVIAVGSERRWRKLPNVITAATIALLAARPLGYLVQKHLTTDGAVGRLNIKDVKNLGIGSARVHLVRTYSED